MNQKNVLLRITYKVTFQDIKKTIFDVIFSKKVILKYGLVALIISLVLETVMIILGFLFDFNFLLIFMMIFIPSLFVFIAILFIPATYLTLAIFWKQTKKLPLEKTWIFTPKRIIIDEVFQKAVFEWEQIKTVDFCLRNTISFKVNILDFYQIPKRVFDEKSLANLQEILDKALDQDKIKKKKE